MAGACWVMANLVDLSIDYNMMKILASNADGQQGRETCPFGLFVSSRKKTSYKMNIVILFMWVCVWLPTITGRRNGKDGPVFFIRCVSNTKWDDSPHNWIFSRTWRLRSCHVRSRWDGGNKKNDGKWRKKEKKSKNKDGGKKNKPSSFSYMMKVMERKLNINSWPLLFLGGRSGYLFICCPGSDVLFSPTFRRIFFFLLLYRLPYQFSQNGWLWRDRIFVE